MIVESPQLILILPFTLVAGILSLTIVSYYHKLIKKTLEKSQASPPPSQLSPVISHLSKPPNYDRLKAYGNKITPESDRVT